MNSLCREIFHGMDVDKSGSITAKEFAAALRRKGSNLPEDHIQQLVEDADIDGDGLIDYEVRLMQQGQGIFVRRCP